MSDVIIATDKITKTYVSGTNEIRALRAVDLVVRRGELVAFTAETAFGEALVGYLKRLGPLTAKAFVGVAAIEHERTVHGAAFRKADH